jgi:ATP-dependent Lon protease
LNDAFNFANRLQQHRQCKEFNVTFVRLKWKEWDCP